MNFIVVAYCTKGGYEEHAQRLRLSLDKLNIRYEIKVIDSLGSWQKNCIYKPEFIKEMLIKYNQPVIYVDADAIFHKYPGIDLDCDFAVHYFRATQLASGTMFFKNSAPAIKLLNAWIEENRLHPDTLDQENLQRVIAKPCWRCGIKIDLLPASYCKIFDLSPEVTDPVIEHFQASRTLRMEENMASLEKRKYAGLWRTGHQASRCADPLANHIIATANKNQNLLEVGCGNGKTARKLFANGYLITGLDITLDGIKGDRSGFIEAPIWRMPFKDNQFDYTFSTDVLEHIPREFIPGALKEIIRVTKQKTYHCIANFSDLRGGVEMHLVQEGMDWWRHMFKVANNKNIEATIEDRKDFLLRMNGEL